MERSIRDRILKLKDLPEAWLDELSIVRVDPVEFDWLADLFDKYPDELDKPTHVTRWGSCVAFEWALHPLYPSIEVDLLTRKADWSAFKEPGYVGDDFDQFDLQDPVEWRRMIGRIGDLFMSPEYKGNQ